MLELRHGAHVTFSQVLGSLPARQIRQDGIRRLWMRRVAKLEVMLDDNHIDSSSGVDRVQFGRMDL